LAKLIVVHGPQAGQVFPLKQSQTLGRLPANDIVLKGQGASRQHARVWLREGRFHVLDLNSKNGIFVNGARVHRSPLGDGDRLVVGETELRFVQEMVSSRAGRDSNSPARRAKRPGREAVQFGRNGAREDPARRVVSAKRTQQKPNLSPAQLWLRGDFSQFGGLGKLALVAVLLLLLAGLIYLGYNLSAN